MTRSFVLFVSC